MKMGNLPEEENREEHNGREADLISCSSPPHHRGESAWNSTDKSRKWRDPLQRGVEEEVGGDRDCSQKARQEICAKGQESYAGKRENSAKPKNLRGTDTTRRKRAPFRPPHHRIIVPLDVLVKSTCTATDEQGSNSRPEERPELDTAGRRKIKTAESC